MAILTGLAARCRCPGAIKLLSHLAGTNFAFSWNYKICGRSSDIDTARIGIRGTRAPRQTRRGDFVRYENYHTLRKLRVALRRYLSLRKWCEEPAWQMGKIIFSWSRRYHTLIAVDKSVTDNLLTRIGNYINSGWNQKQGVLPAKSGRPGDALRSQPDSRAALRPVQPDHGFMSHAKFGVERDGSQYGQIRSAIQSGSFGGN
jgi:hypothetical protein